jgi:hypothetical protein
LASTVTAARVWSVVGFLLAPRATLADECVTLKPIPISGRFCGRVFEMDGAPLAGGGMRVRAVGGRIVAETTSARNGDFGFPRLPDRTYQVEVTGWRIFGSWIDVKDGQSSTCGPVSVTPE